MLFPWKPLKPPFSSGISQKGNLVTRPFFIVASAECTRRRVKDLELAEKLGLLRQKKLAHLDTFFVTVRLRGIRHVWTSFVWAGEFKATSTAVSCHQPYCFQYVNIISGEAFINLAEAQTYLYSPPKPSQDMPGGTQPSRLESWLATRASITILVMLIHTGARGKFCWTSSRGIHPSVEDDFSKWKSQKKNMARGSTRITTSLWCFSYIHLYTVSADPGKARGSAQWKNSL